MKLDINQIESMLKDAIASYPDIRYAIKASVTSRSIYLRLYLGKVFVSRRISDHPTYKNVKTLLVTKSTKRKHIENFLASAVENLRYRDMMNLFDELKGD